MAFTTIAIKGGNPRRFYTLQRVILWSLVNYFKYQFLNYIYGRVGNHCSLHIKSLCEYLINIHEMRKRVIIKFRSCLNRIRNSWHVFRTLKSVHKRTDSSLIICIIFRVARASYPSNMKLQFHNWLLSPIPCVLSLRFILATAKARLPAA